MNHIDIIAEGKRVLKEESEAISNSLESINDEFAQAVVKIANANKIIVSGVGKSGLIGRKIAATLSSIGISSAFIHPVDALHGDIGLVQKGDVAILLSKSGSTDEIIKFIPFLKMREALIISITGKSDSLLGNNSDFIIKSFVDSEAGELNLAPTSSTTLALVLGDALAMAAMKYRGFTREDFARMHPLGQLGRNITLQVKEVMKKGEELPIINTQDDFKTALIEMTQKALGCVCIVDKNYRLNGIITDGDVRRNLQQYDSFAAINIADIMTKSPITISPSDYLGDALAIMEKRDSQISVLPVVEEGNLIGLIRIHDIISSGI